MHKSSLTQKVIEHLNMNLQYAIAQNQNNEKELGISIRAIVPHAYGDHSCCPANWCRYSREKKNYEHNRLDQDLSDTELRKDLEALFAKYSSEKLANLGSTQRNESLNQVVSTKAPKAKNFGGSKSLSYRVAASTAQVTVGRPYVVKVSIKPLRL